MYNSKKEGEKYVVHTSFRKNGKVTSANCGIISDIKTIREKYPTNDEFQKYLNTEASRIYNERKENESIKHCFTYIEDKETLDYKSIYSSQVYLRVLWEKLGLKKELDDIKNTQKKKYKFDLNEVIFFLVCNQIYNPSSKLGAYVNKADYHFSPKNMTLDSLYDSLSVLEENSDAINLKTYKKAKKYLEKSSRLYFYDVTSVNMSKTVQESSLIGYKKGKEGIYGPIIQIGYLCDERGLLIGLLVFKGNKSEQPSLKEQIEKVFQTSKIKDIVICTDAGLCSIKNKRYSERVFKGYITTQPLTEKKVPEHIRTWAAEAAFGYDDETFTIKEIIEKYEQAVKDNDVDTCKALMNKTFFKHRWYKNKVSISYDGKETLTSLTAIENLTKDNDSLSKISENDLNKPEKGKPKKIEYEQRLVVSFNLKYYFKQLNDLINDFEKAKRAVEEKSNVKECHRTDFRRFIKTNKVTENGEIIEEKATTLLTEKFEQEKKMCGIYCQATNLCDEPSIIYKSARERWIIEHAFRTSKTDLGMGTVYLQKEEHIKGHFEICFLAQMLLRVLIYKLYIKLGYYDTKSGKLKSVDDPFTQNDLINELIKMKSMVKKDDKGEECLIAQCNKTKITSLLAEIFGISLTTQVRKLSDISRFVK